MIPFILRTVLCITLLWPVFVYADAFPRPEALAPAVEFWKRVYTEVDTASGLLHDEWNLAVVYEAMRFSESTSPSTRQRRVDERKAYYRAILQRLAAGKRDGLSVDERKVLALWPEDVSDATLRRAADEIRFQLGQSDRFAAGLARSGAWERYIRSAFTARGLPEELALLPHVESSFNPNAYSWLGAAGMWQFITSTGRRYLRIDHVIDERLDPYAATEAAVELLAHNYAVTGSWPLAITAYNHGAAGMRRAVDELGTDDIAAIVFNYDSRTFGFASRNFYTSFLAALEVHNEAERYFPGVAREAEQPLRTVVVKDYIPMPSLARALDIEAKTLRAYNGMLMPPVWSGEKHVPKGYALRLPPGSLAPDEAAAALAAIPAWQRFAQQVPDEFYVVQRGDTLSGIADYYDVSIHNLTQRNQLSSSHFIRAGQRLRLPGSEPVIVAAAASQTVDGPYRVRQGDTLWGIAARYGLKVAALAEINDLGDADTLHPGQVLALEQTAGTDKPAVEPEQEPETAIKAVAERPTETALAKLEAAEPVSPEAASETGTVTGTPAHPAPSADPANYEAAADGTIEVQAVETLGHYADWLGIRTQNLRDLNGLQYGQAVTIGQRLKLDFSMIDAETFTARRIDYHRALQEQFFASYRIGGVREQTIRAGDNLWSLANRERNLPLWLLRQYNPDLDSANLQPGMQVNIPELVAQESSGEAG